MDELFQIPGEITKIESMSNGRVRLRIDSQENMTPQAKGRMMELANIYGWFCFLPGEKEIEATQVLDLDLPDMQKDEKSLSKRMRNVLYRIWESRGMPNPYKAETNQIAFDLFYRDQMEKLLEQLKGLIDA